MSRRCHIVLALVALAAAPMLAWAQPVKMDIEPRVARIGETLRMTITVEGTTGADAPQPPPIDGMQVRSGGQQTSISMVNGQVSRSTSFTYILTPTRTGTFSIGPFNYPHGNDTVVLPAVTIEVVGAGGGSPGQANSIDDLVRARFAASTTNLYPQRTFTLMLTLYYRGINLDRNLNISGLEQTGLKFGQPSEVRGGREVLDGEVFDTRRFVWQVTPLTAGEFNLTPSLQLGVLVENRRQRGDPFGSGFFDAFFGGVEVQRLDVNAEPLVLAVEDFPVEGRPPEFTGAVGSFTFDVKANPTSVRIGDPVTVTLSIMGQGNVASLRPPQWLDSDRFRVYEPRLAPDPAGNGDLQRVIYEQVVIPRTPDATELPALTFAFFDPDTGSYRTLTSGPIALTLTGPTGTTARILQATATPAPVAPITLGEDIGYLKPVPTSLSKAGDAAGLPMPVVLGLQSIPPIALALLFLVARRRDDLRVNHAKARRLQAPRVARKALQEAEAAIKTGNAPAFYDALWRAFADYFGHRLNLPPGDVELDVITRRLRNASVDEAIVQRLADIVTACELNRYGSSGMSGLGDGAEARRAIDDLGKVLHSCERIRW